MTIVMGQPYALVKINIPIDNRAVRICISDMNTY